MTWLELASMLQVVAFGVSVGFVTLAGIALAISHVHAKMQLKRDRLAHRGARERAWALATLAFYAEKDKAAAASLQLDDDSKGK